MLSDQYCQFRKGVFLINVKRYKCIVCGGVNGKSVNFGIKDGI